MVEPHSRSQNASYEYGTRNGAQGAKRVEFPSARSKAILLHPAPGGGAWEDRAERYVGQCQECSHRDLS